MLSSKRRDFKMRIKKAISNWWFKITIFRKCRKRIIKLFYDVKYIEGKDISSFFIYKDNFKYSDEELKRVLELLVKKGELIKYTASKVENADGYILVVATKNRSQNRILKAVPIEIDLNQVKLDPISKENTNSGKSESSEQPEPITEVKTETVIEDNSKPF